MDVISSLVFDDVLALDTEGGIRDRFQPLRINGLVAAFADAVFTLPGLVQGTFEGLQLPFLLLNEGNDSVLFDRDRITFS
jgi:hypothetical protein